MQNGKASPSSGVKLTPESVKRGFLQGSARRPDRGFGDITDAGIDATVTYPHVSSLPEQFKVTGTGTKGAPSVVRCRGQCAQSLFSFDPRMSRVQLIEH